MRGLGAAAVAIAAAVIPAPAASAVIAPCPGVEVIFARVGPTLRADMDRHGVTEAVGAARIFATRHEALKLTRGGEDGPDGPT